MMTTSSPSTKHHWEKLYPYLFIAPALILFCMFVFYPFIKTITHSFTLTDAHGNALEFVGLENFERLFKNSTFKKSIVNSLKFAPMIYLPSLLLGLILALAAANRCHGSRTWEVMYSLPMAVASTAAAVVWQRLLAPTQSGLLNFIFNTDISWLLDKRYALLSVAIVTIWTTMAYNYIFLLTGLKNVSNDLIESAMIDGANYFQRLFHVILPMASSQIFFVSFLDIVISFQAFGQVKMLTQGGPNNSTNILVYNIYHTAMRNARFETAFAQSCILFLIIMTLTVIQFSLEDKVVNYQ